MRILRVSICQDDFEKEVVNNLGIQCCVRLGWTFKESVYLTCFLKDHFSAYLQRESRKPNVWRSIPSHPIPCLAENIQVDKR